MCIGQAYDVCMWPDLPCVLVTLTISVRQAAVATYRAVTLGYGRPLDRLASGNHNVKFENLFNTNPLFHYVEPDTAFKDDGSAIQCQ